MRSHLIHYASFSTHNAMSCYAQCQYKCVDILMLQVRGTALIKLHSTMLVTEGLLM